MSLAFLFPLAWLGALALAVPIWLHLERRREANLIEFSALRFLEDQPLARSRPWWPRDIPLLLLRLAALLLLVAAFSWPYVMRDDPPILATRSTVFIFDNTLSQQAAGQFAQLRRELVRQLGGAGEVDQVAVIELLSVPHVLVPFGTDRDEAVRLVEQISPSHQRGSYRAAFLMAGELLRQSLGSQRQIVFLGDHQENQWEESAEGAPFLDDVELVLSPPKQRALPNLALSQPRVRRFFLGEQGVAECLVQLSRFGAARSAEVELRTGKSVIARQTITLQESEPMTTLAFQWPVESSEWLEGEVIVSGEPDSLKADNRVAFALPPIRPGTVDLMAQSKYLQTALGPDVMQSRWEIRTVHDEELQKVPADRDVLCVESRQLEHPQAWQRLLAYLNQGKGVLLIIDEVMPRVSSQLRRLELEVGDRVELRSPGRLRYYFQDHPLFLPFRSPDFGDLLEINVRRYHRVDLQGGQPLMFSQSGDPLLLQGGLQGNLFVLSFGLDREHTNWVIHPTFVPFLDHCLTQARNLPPQQSEYAPGEVCVWAIGGDANVREIVLRQGGEVMLRAAVERGAARFTLPDPPGLYHLSHDDASLPEAILQVNPPAEESRLIFVDPDPLAERWVFRTEADRDGDTREAAPDTSRDLPLATTPATMDRMAILRQRAWWWLLLAAAAALVVETSWLTIRRE
jgi:hypothetical protein